MLRVEPICSERLPCPISLLQPDSRPGCFPCSQTQKKCQQSTSLGMQPNPLRVIICLSLLSAKMLKELRRHAGLGEACHYYPAVLTFSSTTQKSVKAMGQCMRGIHYCCCRGRNPGMWWRSYLTGVMLKGHSLLSEALASYCRKDLAAVFFGLLLANPQ